MFSHKSKRKGFTLIEMLIVIVIIGILMAALIPRLSSARGRANDVARKADLAQTASALVSHQIDVGNFPSSIWKLSLITTELVAAWMSSLPSDPNASRVFSGISGTGGAWEYVYTSIYKAWIPRNGFVLMAWTETVGWSNRVYTWTELTSSRHYEDIKLCKIFTNNTGGAWTNDWAWNCTYNEDDDDLRYIYVY